jgi:hypothetical protein
MTSLDQGLSSSEARSGKSLGTTLCLLNVWFDTIKLKPKTAKKLAPHSKHIKFAADKRNPIVKRRTRLVQKGEGFLPFLLTSVLEQLANFL